jgi:hypothetical protein
MFVMPPFTYPNLSPYNHRVITTLWDLQIFPCPTNEDATRAHLATSSNVRTSSTPMISVIVHRHLEASSTGMTSSVTSCLRLGSTVWMTWRQGSAVWMTWSYEEVKVCCDLHYRAKVHQDPYLRVSLDFGISMPSGRAAPTVAPHRWGSIPMSQSCDSCKEIPPKRHPHSLGLNLHSMSRDEGFDN